LIENTHYFFYETGYLNEEVNRIELSLSVSVPRMLPSDDKIFIDFPL